MKRYLIMLGGLLVAAPSVAQDGYEGEVNIGLRATHYASGQRSAKYDEYLDQSDGLFGDGWLRYRSDDYLIETSSDSSAILQVSGERFGLFKGRVFYDDYTHNLSRNAVSPADGIGTTYLQVPDASDPALVPPLSSWQEFDYAIDKTTIGGEVTVHPDSPFYSRFSCEQHHSDGIMPYGTVKFTGFELPMPVDYTTTILNAESGYRDRETAVTLSINYNDFRNDNDLLTVTDGILVQEYSMAPDNYSYTLSGAIRQRLAYDSLLDVQLSYSRNISDADFDTFTTLKPPESADDYTGDVADWQARVALGRGFGDDLDGRVHYTYLDRSNDSDEVVLDSAGENTLYGYEKHQAGIDLDYRYDHANLIGSGYEFVTMTRDREYIGRSNDHRVYGTWNNTSLDRLETRFRLEYLHRDADTDYDAVTLEVNNDLIYQYFKPYDVVSKESFLAGLTLDFSPVDKLDLSLSYTMVYDDYLDDDPGLQNEQRHEIYLDTSYHWSARARCNLYLGYEYSRGELDSSWTSLASSPASLAGTYLWGQDTTYGFWVIGGSVTVPLRWNLELEMTADYQVGDGKIDYSEATVATEQLEALNTADDYYRTQLGIKARYTVKDNVFLTAGYQFEKARLDEWLYDMYSYTSAFSYLSGAGLYSDYEAHQWYLVWNYSF